jgi:hypothetical protein
MSALVAVPSAEAHGIAGNRYFPDTLTFDDPAVADELILPNFSSLAHPNDNENVVARTKRTVSSERRIISAGPPTPSCGDGIDN